MRTHALVVRVMTLLPPSPFPVGFGTMPRNTRDLSYAVPPSTYEDPTVESPVAFPSGNDLFIQEFVLGRIQSIDQLLRGVVRTTNLASPSLPIRQAMNCLLRSCISQKRGHLVRAIPPDNTAKFSASIDEKLVAATEYIFTLEELGELQKELLFLPASRGGWGFSSLSNTKEVAYIAGVAATPYTEQPPPRIPESKFKTKVTEDIQKAIDEIKQKHELDITEKTRVNASEFAHGGYTKVQSILGKAVNEQINEQFWANKEPNVLNWIDAGSSAELPRGPLLAGGGELGYHTAPQPLSYPLG